MWRVRRRRSRRVAGLQHVVVLVLLVAGAGISTASCGNGGAAPGAPSSLMWQGDGANEVVLQWVPPSHGRSDVTGYDVYRNGTLLASVTGVSHTSYADAAVIPGTALSYTVKATDAQGNRSGPTPALTVNTANLQQGSFALGASYGPTYCRRGGDAGSVASQDLECTVFNGTTWTTSVSPGGIDWGYDIGWAWVSDQGNPAYCRRTGEPSAKFAEQNLACTVFDGTTWTTSFSPAGIDWGYDVGWGWASDQGNPAYCRRGGDAGSIATQDLECTVFNGTTWTTSVSPSGVDWGYDVGWAWVSDHGNPSYCRRTGDPSAKFALQHLACSAFKGTGWTTSVSPPGIDWGYDIGWGWVSSNGDPVYCRRGGTAGSFATQDLECTGFNGTTWDTSDSPTRIDWGYDVGWAWVTARSAPAYCRRGGDSGSIATQDLECTVFNGLKWSTATSAGGVDWGYATGSQWVSDAAYPTYCRHTGIPTPKFTTQHLSCTTYFGLSWSTSASPGGIDWGFDVGAAWLGTSG